MGKYFFLEEPTKVYSTYQVSQQVLDRNLANNLSLILQNVKKKLVKVCLHFS